LKMPPLQRYPVYKDSGVECLGSTPEGWEIIRANYLFKIINERSKDGKEELLTVSEHDGVRPRSECNVNMFMAESYKGYKICYHDDLVINSLWAWSRGLGFSKYHGIVSTAYSVFRLSDNKCRSIFLNYLLRIKNYVDQYFILSKGVWISRLQLSDWAFLRIPILIPPIPEQTAIASFLDEKCRKIDRSVAQKKKLVELLKERKQIAIKNAVTKGLNPNSKMKDSGVEWIGEIPEHWEVMKCKYLFYETDERSLEGKEELLSVSHITGVTPRSEKDVNMFLAENYAGSKLCQKGDLIYNIMWAWMGALGVSNQEGIVSPSYGVYRQKHHDNFNPSYLEKLLRSNKYIEHYNKVSTGLHSSRLRFYSHMFFSMKIGFPKKNEQDEIVVHIEKESIKIDKAITLQQKQIEKLKEYKATLINSAVTGKIKVVQ